MEQPQAQPDRAADAPAAPADDAADVARVAALVARAGLRLTTAEIAQLVAEYRYDRRGFDLMRTMLAAEDETAHAFQAARVLHPSGGGGGASAGTTGDAAGAESGQDAAGAEGDR